MGSQERAVAIRGLPFCGVYCLCGLRGGEETLHFDGGQLRCLLARRADQKIRVRNTVLLTDRFDEMAVYCEISYFCGSLRKLGSSCGF